MLSSKLENTETILNVNENVTATMNTIFGTMSFKGENPKVFKYQIHVPEEINYIGCVRLIFYEGFEVVIFVKREL